MSEKQDRQGVRTALDLERKYQFDKRFAELMGISLDAQKSISEIGSSISKELIEQSTSITRNAEEIRLQAERTEKLEDDLDGLGERVTHQETNFVQNCEAIVLNALKEYVDKETYEKFETEFRVFAQGISASVSTNAQDILDAQKAIADNMSLITKYFSFDINGLEIGATYTDENGVEHKSPNKVIIDNDEIIIEVNGRAIQYFKADGTALIPTLKVTNAMSIVGLQITEDSTHINFDYIGGE